MEAQSEHVRVACAFFFCTFCHRLVRSVGCLVTKIYAPELRRKFIIRVRRCGWVSDAHTHTHTQDLPIHNVEELMASGMPYTAVTYGMAVEDKIANYPEKLYRDFWANRIDVPYQEFPFERVSEERHDLA